MSAETTVGPDWHVDVEGCVNFRDAGGWELDDGRRMRSRHLYRSDDPVRLTARGRNAVRSLGIGFVVDLRQRAQAARGAGFLPIEQTARIPLVDRVIDPDAPPSLLSPIDLADLYDEMLDRSRQSIADVLDHVAAHVAAGPVLVHCAYGKDRAGLVTALVQSAIGVPAESIVVDYARSHEPSTRRRAWMLREPLPGDPDLSMMPGLLFSAPPTSMRMLLDRMVERHGSLDEWPSSLPIKPDTVARLRDGLVER